MTKYHRISHYAAEVARQAEVIESLQRRNDAQSENIGAMRKVEIELREKLKSTTEAYNAIDKRSEYWERAAISVQRALSDSQKDNMAKQDRIAELQKDLAHDEAMLLRQREVLIGLMAIKSAALNLGVQWQREYFIASRSWADLTWRDRRRALRTAVFMDDSQLERMHALAATLNSTIAAFHVDSIIGPASPNGRSAPQPKS